MNHMIWSLCLEKDMGTHTWNNGLMKVWIFINQYKNLIKRSFPVNLRGLFNATAIIIG